MTRKPEAVERLFGLRKPFCQGQCLAVLSEWREDGRVISILEKLLNKRSAALQIGALIFASPFGHLFHIRHTTSRPVSSLFVWLVKLWSSARKRRPRPRQ